MREHGSVIFDRSYYVLPVFMRKLEVKEIHGFSAALGLKLLKPSFLEIAEAREADGRREKKRTKEKLLRNLIT